MKRILLLVVAILCMSSAATFGQASEEQQTSVKETKYKYAYVFVEGKVGKKLKVHIDLGNEEFPVSNKKQAIKVLRKSRSYAAVINFMLDHGYEVVSIEQAYEQSGGNGGTNGISCVMKKAIITEMPEPVTETQAVVEETPAVVTPATQTQEEVVAEEVEKVQAPAQETPEVEELKEVPANED